MTKDIIKQLREQTGAGLLDVKSALEEAGGDSAKAVEILRKKGAMKMGKLGFDYTTILKHYFTAIHIIDMKKLEFFTEE